MNGGWFMTLGARALACWHSQLACQHSRASTRVLSTRVFSTQSNAFFPVCILVDMFVLI